MVSLQAGLRGRPAAAAVRGSRYASSAPRHIARRCGGSGRDRVASLVERHAFTLRRVAVPVLPAGHGRCGSSTSATCTSCRDRAAKAAWVAALADLRPDLVVNTGDNISHPDAIPVVLEASPRSRGSRGVRPRVERLLRAEAEEPGALPHARSSPRGSGTSTRLPTEDLVKGMLDLGWTDLTNPRATLDRAARGWSSSASTTRTCGTTGTGSSAAPLRRRGATMGVTHAPYQRILDAHDPRRGPVVIAGHTHGGQVCVPFYGALVTNCDLDRGRAKGLSRWWPGAGGTLPGRHSHRMPPGSRCPQGSGRRRMRRSGSPADPRRRC